MQQCRSFFNSKFSRKTLGEKLSVLEFETDTLPWGKMSKLHLFSQMAPRIYQKKRQNATFNKKAQKIPIASPPPAFHGQMGIKYFVNATADRNIPINLISCQI